MNNNGFKLLVICISVVFIRFSAQLEAFAQGNTEIPREATKLVYSPHNIVGLTYAENQLKNAELTFQKGQPEAARCLLIPLLKWLEDITEYHAELYKVLKNIDTATTQADVEKELALKSAILRDKTMYQLGLVLIAQKKYKEAVPYLVKVVKSQPATDIGFKAYEKLQQIGFTYKIQLETTPQ